MNVEVAYAGPEGQEIVALDLPANTTLADAVARSDLIARLGLDAGKLDYAIFGERATPTTPLREGDRVELTRPLAADPKAARRARAAENPLPRPRPPANRRRSSR